MGKKEWIYEWMKSTSKAAMTHTSFHVQDRNSFLQYNTLKKEINNPKQIKKRNPIFFLSFLNDK